MQYYYQSICGVYQLTSYYKSIIIFIGKCGIALALYNRIKTRYMKNILRRIREFFSIENGYTILAEIYKR
jgi:hypothetical protein